jgi:hypothetical protein
MTSFSDFARGNLGAMEGRSEDLREDGGDLPLPGTSEPEEPGGAERRATEGPGNVSVDEPTQPVMRPDESPDEADDDSESSDSDSSDSDSSDSDSSDSDSSDSDSSDSDSSDSDSSASPESGGAEGPDAA